MTSSSQFSSSPKTSNRSCGASSPAKSARRKMRFRRCATPQYCASKQRHAKEKSSPALSSPASGHEPGYGLGTTSSGKEIRTISSSTILKSSYFGVPLEKAPGTFSQHIQRGRISTPKRPRFWSAALISRTIRICSIKRPERAPARPALAPATDRSWLFRIRDNQDYAEEKVIPKSLHRVL